VVGDPEDIDIGAVLASDDPMRAMLELLPDDQLEALVRTGEKILEGRRG
jgi:hypothetical protein